MKSAVDMIQENRAFRQANNLSSDKKVVLKSTQSLQSKIENAEMITHRWSTTTREEAQKLVGMTDQEIENFKRI